MDIRTRMELEKKIEKMNSIEYLTWLSAERLKHDIVKFYPAEIANTIKLIRKFPGIEKQGREYIRECETGILEAKAAYKKLRTSGL